MSDRNIYRLINREISLNNQELKSALAERNRVVIGLQRELQCSREENKALRSLIMEVVQKNSHEYNRLLLAVSGVYGNTNLPETTSALPQQAHQSQTTQSPARPLPRRAYQSNVNELLKSVHTRQSNDNNASFSGDDADNSEPSLPEPVLRGFTERRRLSQPRKSIVSTPPAGDENIDPNPTDGDPAAKSDTSDAESQERKCPINSPCMLWLPLYYYFFTP